MRVGLLGCLILTLAVFGCNSGPRQASVKGDVTFAGDPVEEGSISFFPEAEGGRKASAAILNGKYEIPAERGPLPGRFKVEITWSKKTGRKIPSNDPGILVEETREVIPARYNQASTLMRDIGPGENRLDFTLDP